MTAYLLGSATQPSVGRIGLFRKSNRAMTQAEMTERGLAGISEADRGGSGVPVYESDFSAGVDGWAAGTANTITGNIDGIDGRDNWLRCTRTSGTGANIVLFTPPVIFAAGKIYEVTALIFIPSGSPITHWGILGTAQAVTANTTTAVTLRFVAPETLTFGARDGSGNTASVVPGTEWYATLVSVKQIGNTIDLQPSSIQLAPGQWLDTANGTHALIPEGARLADPRTSGQLRSVHTWDSSADPQYVGGADQAVLPQDSRITQFSARATVAGEFDIGDESYPARYASGVTIGDGWTDVSLPTPFHDGVNRKVVVTPTSSYTGQLELALGISLLG